MVTDCGELEADLPPHARELLQKYPGLADLFRRGLVRLPLKPKEPNAYPLLPSVTPSGTAAKLLDWVRGDR
jgi:hypothetical protein